MADGLPPEVLRRVVAALAVAYGVSQERVRSTAALRSFKGGDSLDIVDLVLALDDELRDGDPNHPAATGARAQ